MNVQRILGVLAFSLISIADSQAGDAAKGQALSSACSACHGVTGLSVSEEYPNLAGQKQAYLIKALQQYQSGQRSNSTMQAEVGPLSAQDIENLAAYFTENSTIPSYSKESRILHIPVVSVLSEHYQADMEHLSESTFGLTTVKPLK